MTTGLIGRKLGMTRIFADDGTVTPVTVIEAGETGGLATRASWAWINASWGNPEPYFRLCVRAIEQWHKMQSEIPQLAINWCGGLIWDLPLTRLWK
mgnify:CR=1 FL=1